MVHLRPVILALLLALAAPTAAISTSAPSTQSAQSSLSTTMADVDVYAPGNTSSVLTLGGDADETRAFATAGTDIGTALNVHKSSMAYQLESYSFTAQFEQAETREDKRDLLIKYMTEIDTQTVALESRERAARRGFQNGSISAEKYVRTLILIDAKARHLHDEIDAAQDHADDVDQFTLSGYLGPYEKRLLSLQGPAREELSATAQGKTSATRYYVSAADNGVVLAFISRGTYHREVYRSDHRTLDGNNQYNSSAIQNRIDRFYPWPQEDGNLKGSSFSPNRNGGYDNFGLEHPHGELGGYFDKSTGLVFRESQQKHLTSAAAGRHDRDETIPKGPGVTANESNLVLTVNRSYPGGPMYVSLQDNETGKFVEGSITIDGEPVGETTTEGGLWTLSPAGSFNVSASSGLDIVTVETRATRPITETNSTQA